MNFSTQLINSLTNFLSVLNPVRFIQYNPIILIILLFFLTSNFLPAQNWLWAKGFQTSGWDIGFDVAVDADNNAYFTGQTNNTDIFWKSYDPSGILLNTVIVPTTSSSIGKDIAVDNLGNVYMIGDFAQTANFGPGNILNATGARDIFLAKYNSAASLIWVRHIEGDFHDSGEGLVLDAADNILITGNFKDELCFEGGGCVTSIGGSAFMAKYDPSGTLVWARTAKTGGGLSRDIAVNSSGEVVICGNFVGSLVVGGMTYPSTGGGDIFLAKFQDNGNTTSFQWGRAAGGTDSERAFGVAINENGKVYVTGTFEGTVDFDPASGVPPVTAAPFSSDFFLVLYNEFGNGGWWAHGTGTGDIIGLGLKLDKEGNPHVSGSFEDTADFDGASISWNGNKNSFVAKYRGDLELISIQRSGASTGSGVAIGSDGQVYTTGAYNVTADFPPTPSLPGAPGDNDAYIAKLDCIPPIADFIVSDYPTCTFLWIGVDGSPSQFESHFRWIITPSDQFGAAIGPPLYDTGWSPSLNSGTIFGGLQPGYYTVTH